MDTTADSVLSTKPAATHSCQRCAVRKTKCDKQQPCGACLRHNAECEYRSLSRPRRRKRIDRTDLLAKRLEQYERLLHQKEVDPGSSPKASGNNTSPLATSRGHTTDKDTLLLKKPNHSNAHPLSALPQDQVLVHDQGRSKYVDKYVCY